MNNGILKLKDKERTFSRGTVKKDAFRGFGGVTHRIRSLNLSNAKFW